jgi:hypothetical protein
MEGSNTKILFVSWWYTEACDRLFAFIKHLYTYIYDLFSVKICFQTFFSPWKRDQIGYQGLSLSQMFQVWVLNLSSRFIGSFIKFFTLVTFLAVVSIYSVCALLSIIIWVAYPIILLGLIIFGFKTLFGA